MPPPNYNWIYKLLPNQCFICVFIGVFFMTSDLKTQNRFTNFSTHFGLSLDLNYEKKRGLKGSFPGIKAFVGLNSANELVNKNDKTRGLFNLSTCIVVYNKSLGNSLDISFQDNQIDWTSSITFGYNAGDWVPVRQLQSINNSPFYNILHRREKAILASVNFIMNNHLRNQTNGAFTLTYKKVSINYYNDGAFPANLGIGDQFDRYWTGGFAFYYHDQIDNGVDTIGFNRAEFSFDQFTGYTPQLYELSNIMGLDIQDYDLYTRFSSLDTNTVYSVNVGANGIKSKRRSGYDFNASSYRAKYRFNPNFGASMGVLGSLRSKKKGRYFSIQDMIHLNRGIAIHPNKVENKFFIGLQYNSQL